MAMGVSTVSGPARSSLLSPCRPVSARFRFRSYWIGCGAASTPTMSGWRRGAAKVETLKNNLKLAKSVMDNITDGRLQLPSSVVDRRSELDLSEDGSGYRRKFGNFLTKAHYPLTKTAEEVFLPNGVPDTKFPEPKFDNAGQRGMNGSKSLPFRGQGMATSSGPQVSPGEKLIRIYDKVLVVDNVLKAREVVAMLTTKYRDLIYACDTEVANIDVKQETPVGHGEVICFSIYCGSQADFGSGKSCIWVDVLDGGRSVLMEFTPFFEDSSIKKNF